MKPIRRTKGGFLKATTRKSRLKLEAPPMSESDRKAWLGFTERMQRGRPGLVERGQVWSTCARALGIPQAKEDVEPRLVIVMDTDGETLLLQGKRFETILVAPVSTNTLMATQWDFLVEQDDSPLGYEFMVETWNKTAALENNLNSYLGLLSSGLMDLLDHISKEYDAREGESGPVLGVGVGEGVVEPGNELYYFQRNELASIEYLRNSINILEQEIQAGDTTINRVLVELKERRARFDDNANLISKLWDEPDTVQAREAS